MNMLTIATMNIQNKYKIKGYDGLYNGQDNIKILLELLKKYNLDIVGLQEVNPRYFSRLEKMLPSCYLCYGKSRYPKNIITNKISVLQTFNESVPIITNKKVLESNTKLLPFLSSLVPRIVTTMVLEIEDFGPITVLNTHLDNLKNTTKVKELKYLLKMIKKIRTPVILMGDFNMTMKNQDFLVFIEDMKLLHISHVDIGEKTFKEAKSNYAIDHLFLSDCFIVDEIILEKSRLYQHFSDHYPVILKIRFGFLKN